MAMITWTKDGKAKINDKTYPVDFDDVNIIEKLLETESELRSLSESKKESREVLADFIAMCKGCRDIIDLVLGKGSYDGIFDGKMPISKTIALISELSKRAGIAYDSMFSDYKK